MLQTDWFYNSPIDFEHKNYLLMQYLKSIDESYSKCILSPYLLWTEKLVSEIKSFIDKLISFEKSIRTDIVSIDLVNFKIKRANIEKNPEMKEIISVIDYSYPLLNSKIETGYFLLSKYPQVLF